MTVYIVNVEMVKDTTPTAAGVPNGEFPEILIAKCRSRFFGT
jgi:hypothetical protein